MSEKRKEDKGIIPAKRGLTAQEVLELQEIVRLVNARNFEATQIKANTALIPDGQKVAEQIEAIARLLENVKNQWVAQKLSECGYDAGTKCNINLSSGAIILTPEEALTVSPLSEEIEKEIRADVKPEDSK